MANYLQALPVVVLERADVRRNQTGPNIRMLEELLYKREARHEGEDRAVKLREIQPRKDLPENSQPRLLYLVPYE